MPLNRLDNFIKNTEGRILYVSPADLDSTDSIENTGNSLARPFKTIQRALIESARFSYIKGNSNDETEKTTILLMPGEHEIDNRPGYQIYDDNGTARVNAADGSFIGEPAGGVLPLSLDSNFDLTQSDNDLYKFNSTEGGVIVPRGTSIVGLDLRKTKIRPKYIPNPTDPSVDYSAIFRITGACYFWQFSIFDGDEFGLVYTQPNNFGIQSVPTFSHNKLTVFEYADGVNPVSIYPLTDLEMYYAKLSIAYGTGTGRTVDSDDKFPSNEEGFNPQRPEYEIVGAFAADPIIITNIRSGDGGSNPTNVITVTTQGPHGLTAGTPIRISGVSDFRYNISTKVVEVDSVDDTKFTYTISSDFQLIRPDIDNEGIVTIETDTVSGASPYIFNISMRSVWGMNGMHADGSKATGFRSMVVAQFTGVSLQKDDRAFVQYIPSTRTYNSTLSTDTVTGSVLSAESSSSGRVYHLESDSVYRQGWEQFHIKISNDAILQIVSVFAIGFNKHFVAESGGDASITNSNSNFGQLSLVSDGFKSEAFEKDDKGFITHIIPPRVIESEEENIDWLAIDLTKPNTTSKLYINGFDNESLPPPVITQGYRIGAKLNDRLYLGSNSALIITPTGESAYKTYSVGAPTVNTFTLSSGTHTLIDGEKVIITSDDGDLPENLKTNIVYYAIAPNDTTIKLAASEAEALAGDAISVYGGTNLTIISRVSDKVAGDEGHPVQYDSNGWYINVSSTGNTIGALSGTEESELTYVKRTPDNRSLDEKIYKFRVVVPSQLSNGKTPEAGFIIQESSSTGFRDDDDATLTTITSDDYDYNRNPGFISNCTYSNPTVTVTTELPHNLKVGDTVIVKNVTGSVSDAFNGTHVVTVVDNTLTFRYNVTANPGTFTNDTSVRDTNLPRFERNDLQSNLYVYRNEVIKEYDEDNQTGIYHIYALNSNNQIQDEFTNLKYSQNVTDLYPQLDRDNINDNPNSTKSYALRNPIGEVASNDLKKSITKESADLLLTSLGIGLEISNVTSSTSLATITFNQDHGFSGIVTYSTLTSGSTYNDGTYYNVKLLNGSQTGTWRGATAKVTVSGGAITEAEVINGGSNYNTAGLYFDQTIVGVGDGAARFNITSNTISNQIGNVIQFTGSTTGQDTYHRLASVSDTNVISIAKTSGDPTITTDYFAYVTAPSTAFTGVGNTITATAHGLVVGNKFRALDASNNNVGDYIVDTIVDINTFTVSGGIGAADGFILKHGLSSNEGISDKSNENLQARAITVFDNETLTLTETGGIIASDTTFAVSNSGIGTIQRFPLGSYIQVDNEIMRIASDSLSGVSIDNITVIRGALATKATSHDENSLIKKVRIPSVEFRRPSIIRASGHTFEYLGYGPGNYSTALPQVQDRTLTEREEFLVQAQERSSGIVVYTGMNNKGDFFIGNQKKSSATGEETTFDTPIPTVTGEDPSRLSAVFDEIIVKERLVVEGGDSGQILSQFDGPVNFTKDVRVKDTLKVTGDAILKNLSATDDTLEINDDVDVDGDITADGFVATTPAFTNLNGNDIYHMLRSNGTQSLITGAEVENALGFVPASAGSITGDFPLGNSIVVDDISSQFNGTSTTFTLLRAGDAFIPAGSSANLIVSIGGVIQKPAADYFIVTNGGVNTNEITFTTPPTSGTTCFIIGLGGQGSLISNIDWDNKGEILAATGDNSAAKVTVGSNGSVLTADSNATTGVSWQPAVPVGAVYHVASSTTPDGYLRCNGDVIGTTGTVQGIDAALLQDLRTVLGTTFGVDGQLPNLSNRFVVSEGGSYSVGATGGAANVTLTINQMPRHRHSLPSNIARAQLSAPGNGNGMNECDVMPSSQRVTGYQGGNPTQSHENRPPYLALRAIIKY